MGDFDATDLEITDEIINELRREWDAKVLKIEHPYVFDLIRVLAPVPRGLGRMHALDRLRRNRERAGLEVPPTFDNTVQSAMQYYCVDSDTFKKRNAPTAEALFCWPKGKGAGHWALMPDNARAWVRKHADLLPGRMDRA